MRATSPDSKVADLVSLDAITVERRGAAFWVQAKKGTLEINIEPTAHMLSFVHA